MRSTRTARIVNPTGPTRSREPSLATSSCNGVARPAVHHAGGTVRMLACRFSSVHRIGKLTSQKNFADDNASP